MKKFVTTLIALLLAFAIALTVSACTDGGTETDPGNEGGQVTGGTDGKTDDNNTDNKDNNNNNNNSNGNDKDVYEQVTKDQWKTAVALFTNDYDLVNIDDLNVTLDSIFIIDEAESYSGTYKVDNANKIGYLFMDMGDIGTQYNYIWQEEDGTVYLYDEYVNEDGGYKEKTILEKAYSNYVLGGFSWIDIFFAFAGSGENYVGTYTGYTDFEDYKYDSKKGGYYCNFVEYGDSYAFTFYFKNGKVVKTELVITYPDEETVYNYVATLVYGETVLAVPEDIKNLEVDN